MPGDGATPHGRSTPALEVFYRLARGMSRLIYSTFASVLDVVVFTDRDHLAVSGGIRYPKMSAMAS